MKKVYRDKKRRSTGAQPGTKSSRRLLRLISHLEDRSEDRDRFSTRLSIAKNESKIGGETKNIFFPNIEILFECRLKYMIFEMRRTKLYNLQSIESKTRTCHERVETGRHTTERRGGKGPKGRDADGSVRPGDNRSVVPLGFEDTVLNDPSGARTK